MPSPRRADDLAEAGDLRLPAQFFARFGCIGNKLSRISWAAISSDDGNVKPGHTLYLGDNLQNRKAPAYPKIIGSCRRSGL